MFLCANRAFLDLEMGPFIGRIGLTADLITKTDGSQNTHGTDLTGTNQYGKIPNCDSARTDLLRKDWSVPVALPTSAAVADPRCAIVCSHPFSTAIRIQIFWRGFESEYIIRERDLMVDTNSMGTHAPGN